MPVKDGIQATLELKEMAARGLIKCPAIIALTAYASQSEREKCEKIGMHGFLTKPVLPKKIKSILEEFNLQH